MFRAKFPDVTSEPLPPFAWALARRAAVAMLASGCLAAAIVVMTDEQTSTAGMRLARVAALGPLLACASVFGVCAHARARGEIGALEALGMTPWGAARGAELAGWVLGLASLLVLSLPWTDPSSLFPRFSPPIDWAMDASSTSARSAFATVLSDGTIELGRTTRELAASSATRWAALACVAPIALAAPAWAVTPMPSRARIASILATAALLIVVLHAIAAERVSAVFGAIASAPLYASLLRGRRL